MKIFVLLKRLIRAIKESNFLFLLYTFFLICLLYVFWEMEIWIIIVISIPIMIINFNI
ncbi:DNA-directed RNA polymerase I subunit RPA1 [Bienertia sinuspersici]